MSIDDHEKSIKVIALVKHTISEDYNGFQATSENNFEYG